jgi:hypothetical protein
MSEPPELPGGEVPDTKTPDVEIGDTQLEPLPGGDVPEHGQRLELKPQSTRLFVQEMVRAGLALSFVVLFAVVIVLGFLEVGTSSWTDAKEFLQILVPVLGALLGSATGFYFGTRR